jgi:four helix bundle protein
MSNVRTQYHKAKPKADCGSVFEEGGFVYGADKAVYGADKAGGTAAGKEGLGIRCYRFVDTLESRSAQLSVRDQLICAASPKRDFLRFYEIALKSSNETKFWLCPLRGAFDPDKSKIEPLLNEATELSNIIAASVPTMKKKR